jgi:phage shock protein PspC (stress-responsive transcriptional regulator)
MVAAARPHHDEVMTEQPESSPLDAFFNALRGTGIRRPKEGRWVGGVAAGLADRLRIDPVIVRVVLFVLALAGGIGVTAYLLAWALLPDHDGSVAAERAVREHDGGSIALCIVTLISVVAPTGTRVQGSWSVPLVAIAIVAVIWYFAKERPAGPVTWTAPAAPSSSAYPQPAWTASSPTVTDAPTGVPAQEPTMTTPPPAAGVPTATTYPPLGSAAPQWQPPPPQPRLPRRRSGGFPLALIAAGLSLIAYQVVRAIADATSVAGNHDALAWGAVIAVLGLVTLGVGLAGWRTGFVGITALVLALLTALSLLTPTNFSPRAGFGDARWRPLTAAELGNNYSLGLGDAVLDLRALNTATLTDRDIAASVGMGGLEILLPTQGTIHVVPKVGLGETSWTGDDGQRHSMDGAGVAAGTLAFGPGQPQLVVTANVGVGDIDIERK